jgi:hypothetical protein
LIAMHRRKAVTGAVLLALTLAGCAGGARGGSDAPGVRLPPSVAQGPAGDTDRTIISLASQQDVAAALRANGVANPEYWAKVVLVNRPYPPNDPSLSKLRQVLAEHHADQGTIDKITNALKP